MKNYFNKYILFAVAGTLALASCEESDLPVDTVTDGITRGAALRTVNLISNELPIGDADAEFSAEFEVQDIEGGTLVDNINIYIAFSDNTVEVGEPDFDVAEALFATLSSADFTEGPFGLPRTSFSVSFGELLSFTGVSEADLFGGDFFPIRFELVLNDGRTFSSTNSNANNLGGSFYSSPFIYFPTVSCPVEATAFVGDYLIEQTTPFSDGVSNTFSSGSVVELAVGTTSVTRTFQTEFYPFFCSGTFAAFSFELICGSISVPNQNNSCNCSDGTDYFTQPDVQETYDINDDSSFLVTFTDDAQSDCGPPVQTTYLFTKQ